MDGYIYAMVGATDEHVSLALNIASDLRQHLRGSNCRVYISAMKVRIESLNRFYYPDVMVTCDERDRNTTTYKCFPCLIIEVLSPSTEAFDRGDKFADYQQLASLQEYILINTKRKRLDCFRRDDRGTWQFQTYDTAHAMFELQSVKFTGSIATLYEDITFETQA